jgi:sugar lactone lactonase YvrE
MTLAGPPLRLSRFATWRALLCAALVLGVLSTLLLSPTRSSAAGGDLSAGDLIAVSGGAIVRVDPVTGAQTFLGAAGIGLASIAREEDGSLLLGDASTQIVYRFDPAVGASFPLVTAPAIQDPQGIAIEDTGSIVVADGQSGRVLRVDPESGATSVVASGGDLSYVTGIAVGPNGALWVVDYTTDSVIRIDPVTGAQTTVLSTGLAGPSGIAIDPIGRVLVTDFDGGKLVRIDPSTGTPTTLSSGATLEAPWGVAVQADGRIIVSAYSGQSLVRIDPSVPDDGIGGNQHVLSTGGFLSAPSGVVVVPTLQKGDAVAVDNPRTAVLRIDPDTGTQTALSTGGLLVSPISAAIDPTGMIATADPTSPAASGGIVRVDPATGAQSFAASGGQLVNPVYARPTADGGFLVADPAAGPHHNGAVYRVSADGNTQSLVAEVTGANSVIAAPNGDLYVGAFGTVIRLARATGAPSSLSSGGQMLNRSVAGLALDAGGMLLCVAGNGVLRVDPSIPDNGAGGNQTVVSSAGYFWSPQQVAVEGDGKLLVTDAGTGSGVAPSRVIRVDPAIPDDGLGGNQSLVSTDAGGLLIGLAVASSSFHLAPIQTEAREADTIPVTVTRTGDLRATAIASIGLVWPHWNAVVPVGVTFGPGERSKNISLSLTRDLLYTGDRAVQVGIVACGGPARAGLSSARPLLLRDAEGLVSGRVYDDIDGDAVPDKDEGLAGVRVYADLDGDAVFDTGEPSGTTLSTGRYEVPVPADTTGEYRGDVRVVPPVGCEVVSPAGGAHHLSVSWAALHPGRHFQLRVSFSTRQVIVSPNEVVGSRSFTIIPIFRGASDVSLPVVVTSSDPTAVLPPPAPPRLLAGNTSMGIVLKTLPVTTTRVVTIGVRIGTETPATGQVTVTPFTVAGLRLSRAWVPGGVAVRGSVTLVGPAPPGGVDVHLGSTNPAVHLPAVLHFNERETSKLFEGTSDVVNAETGGNVTAELNGTTLSQPLTVKRISVEKLTFSQNPSVGGFTVTATVKLEVAPTAVSGPITVQITTANRNVAAPLTDRLIFAVGGGTTKTFQIQTAPVSSSTDVQISALANGRGQRVILAVKPN